MRPIPFLRCRGATLIELVYVVIVIGILAAVLMPVVLNGWRAYETTRQQVSVLDRTRYAMERMAREIREVRFTADQEAELSTASATQLVFTRRALVGGGAGETVTIGHSGTNLTLAYGSMPATGAQLLLASVSSFNLVYLNQAQAVLTLTSPLTASQLASVYAVRIELVVTTPAGQSLSRQTVVQLKNRELL
jgi:Tfp pilus assembly protein PilW